MAVLSNHSPAANGNMSSYYVPCLAFPMGMASKEMTFHVQLADSIWQGFLG